MQKKLMTSLVVAIVLLAAISTIAFAGSRPQPASSLVEGQQIVTMTLGPGMMSGNGMMSGTPMPGANGMAMSGGGCAMMGMAGMNGMSGMNGMNGMSGMGGMTGMSGMVDVDDSEVLLNDPSTWLNNPWTVLGWLLVLVVLLAILAGIVLGILWIVRRSTPARPSA